VTAGVGIALRARSHRCVRSGLHCESNGLELWTVGLQRPEPSLQRPEPSLVRMFTSSDGAGSAIPSPGPARSSAQTLPGPEARPEAGPEAGLELLQHAVLAVLASAADGAGWATGAALGGGARGACSSTDSGGLGLDHPDDALRLAGAFTLRRA